MTAIRLPALTLPSIVTYTTVYEPWEEGADEREVRSERTQTYEYEPGWDPPVIDWGVELLCDLFVSEPSRWPIYQGGIEHLWFSGACYEHPYEGTHEDVSIHLENLTPALRWAIIVGVGYKVPVIGQAIRAGHH